MAGYTLPGVILLLCAHIVTLWVVLCSASECVRCNGFPGNSTSSAGASTCACTAGHFANTARNVAVLERAWLQSNVADHPLSSDYRRILDTFKVKYGVLSSDRAMCILCPPNFVCTGNKNPPMPIADMLRNANRSSLFYGVLAAGAGSDEWWVPCPVVENTVAQLLHRHSVGFSSCFRSGEIWSPQRTMLTSLHLFTFPALLAVNTTNTTIITSIVNIDQDVFSNNMFAMSGTVPVMHLLPDTMLNDRIWVVQLEMDVVGVVAHYADKITLTYSAVLQALHAVDQGTGVAFSAFMPLLWACAVQENTPDDMAAPVFMVPGVAHSVLTEKIVVRTITTVMRIMGISGARPRHVFQLASRQVTAPVSGLHAVANPLFFAHNHLCDSYYNAEPGYARCRQPFAGTLLSTYTTHELAQIRLSPSENELLERSNALHDLLAIGEFALTHSQEFLCPLNTQRGRTIASNDAQRCTVCENSQFWHTNQCQECETDAKACETYTSQTFTRPCSWLHDLQCEFEV